MNVHCELFFRADIARLGVAPLTSMYWYGENERRKAADWRPEIHDSDGLALWTGKGERIWRPLINPPQVQTNSFMDNNPKGFGLMQRDRDFADYQDDGAFYNRRPGIWVEPQGRLGRGRGAAGGDSHRATRSTTISSPIGGPTREHAQAATACAFDYRLYWQDSEPAYPETIAKVVATRLGRGGIPGQNRRPRDAHKFVVDFSGGPLNQHGAALRHQSRWSPPRAARSTIPMSSRWSAPIAGAPLFDLKLDGNEPVGSALLPAPGRQDAQRDLALSIFSLTDASAPAREHAR